MYIVEIYVLMHHRLHWHHHVCRVQNPQILTVASIIGLLKDPSEVFWDVI